MAVPDEISLVISISGCPLRCVGCHSKETRSSDFGDILTDDILQNLLYKHMHISCVTFYGGEWWTERLKELLILVKEYNFKTCLYTGRNKIDSKILEHLDYVKYGPYVEKLGGLESETTNQVMIELETNKDITYKFRR